MSRILYKYLDIGGAQWMLGLEERKYPNLQFTNATQLNDPFDCHPNLIDHEKNINENSPWPKEWLIEKEVLDSTNLRNDTWLCSLSKINDSILMWAHYCYGHKGVCIGLDIEKVLKSTPFLFCSKCLEPYLLDVQYQDIIQRPSGGISPWHYQLSTKAKDWEYEQEVRLIAENPTGMYAAFTEQQEKETDPNKIWDWKKIHQYMPLKGDCFESIYFGINTNSNEKEKIINHARKHLNPNIKLYQMTVDENAFRLKAEEIN